MILITGATGFVGQAVVEQLAKDLQPFRACSRQHEFVFSSGMSSLQVKSVSANTDWSQALQSVDVVIHLAARVHVMKDNAVNPLSEFREVNTLGTLNLAKQAVAAGVKRFVFISTIKVNGEDTKEEVMFSPDDNHVPTDPYALSKYEAEQSLKELAKNSDMDVVIIRPPLIYGPRVKGNFYTMLKWVDKGIPLPLGSINNKRSLLALDNLVSFIIHCANYKKAPQAANEVFLISDNEDVSTTQLLRRVAKAFDKQAILIPIPTSLMTLAAKLIGKVDMAERLFGSLQVDATKAGKLLGWKQRVTMQQQLKKAVDSYLNEKNI